MSWTSTPISAASGVAPRVFSRPLGAQELCFYTDGLFHGATDLMLHSVVQVESPALFSRDSVRRTWIALKRRFPLLGARVEHCASVIQFVIDQARLCACESSEIGFQDAASPEAVKSIVELFNCGSRRLSSDRLSRLTVMRRTDKPDTFHLIITVAHVVGDAVASVALERTFLDYLALSRWGIKADVFPLELVLAGVPAYETLCGRGLSLPRRRWRNAIAYVLNSIAHGRTDTCLCLPGIIARKTFSTPALSLQASATLSSASSAAIVTACRAHGITLGHVIPVIFQVALARVLHRCRARGEISPAEWERKVVRPMAVGAPFGLAVQPPRAETGGLRDRLCMNLGMSPITMPFLPGAAASLGRGNQLPVDASGAPPLEALLSRARFALRARLVRRQQERFMRHPLFLELISQRGPPPTRPGERSVRWTEQVIREAKLGLEPTFAFHFSSLGNLDSLVPKEYPIPASHPLSFRRKSASETGTANTLPPILRLLHLDLNIHRCRPAELYTVLRMSDRRLQMDIHYDGNVFAQAVVEEWLAEAKGAVEWYLAAEVPKIAEARL